MSPWKILHNIPRCIARNLSSKIAIQTAKQSAFFSKSVKKSVKRGVRDLRARALTARAYFNTQKYGLLCSLISILTFFFFNNIQFVVCLLFYNGRLVLLHKMKMIVTWKLVNWGSLVSHWYSINQRPVVRRPISANPRLNFNLGFFFFHILFRASNHQIEDQCFFYALISEFKFRTNPGLS